MPSIIKPQILVHEICLDCLKEVIKNVMTETFSNTIQSNEF